MSPALQMIYCGPLGHESTDLIRYLEAVPGVPAITAGKSIPGLDSTLIWGIGVRLITNEAASQPAHAESQLHCKGSPVLS